MAYTIEIHRHGEGQLPVDTVSGTSLTYTHTTEGTGNFTVTTKLPLYQHATKVRPGDWLVVRRSGLTTIAFGHVDTVSGGLRVQDGGAVVTAPLQIGCSSWFNFLGKTRLYVPIGQAETRGTLMSLHDWSQAAATIFTEYASGSIGVALERLHKLVARIRLPESLGGEYIGDAIPVVHDEDTQRRWAPHRVIDPVNVANGIAGQLSFSFQDASVQELYYASFVPDGRLVEMFPSLETAPEQADSSQTWTGTGPEFRPLPALARILGRLPCLIYRMRPWRPRPLIEATDVIAFNISPTTSAAQTTVPVQNFTTASGATAGVVGTGPVSTYRGSYETKYKQLALLGEFQHGKPPLFSDVTWDTRRAIDIPLSLISGMDFTWDDAARVNCSAINLSTDPGTGAEASLAMGLPISNDESILDHGTRLAKPVWPFTIPRLGDDSWIPYMRSVAAQLMQFQQNAHLMASGSITIRWPDAEVLVDQHWYSNQTLLRPQLVIPVGEIATIAFPGSDQPFYCYVESVSHSVAVQSNGGITAHATIRFSRGLFGIEHVRGDGVAIAALAAGTKAGVKGGVTASQVKKRHVPYVPRVATSTILLGGQEIPWTGGLLIRQLLTKDLSQRQVRAPASIVAMVIHTTDDAVTSTGAGGARTTFDAHPEKDSHLIIEANGTLVQIMDLATCAWHASNTEANLSSIGVDFVCPAPEDRSQDIKDRINNFLLGTVPWRHGTGFSLLGSTTDYSQRVLYLPTAAQIATAKQVIAWACNHLALIRTAPALTGDPKTLQKGATFLGAGIYHHAEVDKTGTRADCLGIYIPRDLL